MFPIRPWAWRSAARHTPRRIVWGARTWLIPQLSGEAFKKRYRIEARSNCKRHAVGQERPADVSGDSGFSDGRREMQKDRLGRRIGRHLRRPRAGRAGRLFQGQAYGVNVPSSSKCPDYKMPIASTVDRQSGEGTLPAGGPAGAQFPDDLMKGRRHQTAATLGSGNMRR